MKSWTCCFITSRVIGELSTPDASKSTYQIQSLATHNRSKRSLRLNTDINNTIKKSITVSPTVLYSQNTETSILLPENKGEGK